MSGHCPVTRDEYQRTRYSGILFAARETHAKEAFVLFQEDAVVAADGSKRGVIVTCIILLENGRNAECFFRNG